LSTVLAAVATQGFNDATKGLMSSTLSAGAPVGMERLPLKTTALTLAFTLLALATLAPLAAAGPLDAVATPPLPSVRAGASFSEGQLAYHVAVGDNGATGSGPSLDLPPGKYFADCVGGKLYIYNVIGVLVGRGACDGTWFEAFIVTA